MVKITFPDGSVKEFAAGTTAYQIAESISPRLAADSLAASVNGATVDLSVAHTVHDEQRLPKHVGATTPITRAFTGARYAFGRAKLVDKTLPKPIQILHRAPPFRRVWREAS